MLPAPEAPGGRHAGLDLVEDEEGFELIASPAQFREELLAEVVLAALALDGFDDDGADLVRPLAERAPHLGDGLNLAILRVDEVRALEREARRGARAAWPVELREERGLALIRRVGQRERVATAAMERVLEVQDLRAGRFREAPP